MGKWNYCFQLHNGIKSHWYSRDLSILSVLLIKGLLYSAKEIENCLARVSTHKILCLHSYFCLKCTSYFICFPSKTRRSTFSLNPLVAIDRNIAATSFLSLSFLRITSSKVYGVLCTDDEPKKHSTKAYRKAAILKSWCGMQISFLSLNIMLRTWFPSKQKWHQNRNSCFTTKETVAITFMEFFRDQIYTHPCKGQRIDSATAWLPMGAFGASSLMFSYRVFLQGTSLLQIGW